MKASSFAGPMIAGDLARQVLAQRMARQSERAALALAGGGVFHVPRSILLPKARRARESFRLVGGELCGCRARSCATCGVEIDLAGGDCPCGSPGCNLCAAPGPTGSPGGAGGPGGPPALPNSLLSPAPTLFPPAIRPWLHGILEPEHSEPSTELVCDGSYFDMHGHNFCYTYDDWAQVLAGATGTVTEQRAGQLYSLKNYGVGCMTVAGMVDIGAGTDAVLDYATVNDITLYVASLHPEFFAPFLQVIPEGGTFAPDAEDYVRDHLADGFLGVGELFVHGHGGNVNDMVPLLGICKAAASYGVPVQVHWEFGNVDDEGIRTPAENFEQLIQLLDQFPNDPIETYTAYSEDSPVPLKLIVCHCGTGPGTMDMVHLTDYMAWMEILLGRYPNVYFDIAGMQVGDEHKLFFYEGRRPRLSDLGQFLIDKIAQFPTRFMFGIDCENRYSSIRMWQNSVTEYGVFLSLGNLSNAEQDLVKVGNAFVVLYSKARVLTVSGGGAGNTGASAWSWP